MKNESLKIAILDVSVSRYSLKDKAHSTWGVGLHMLKDEIRKQGHTPALYYAENCQMFFNGRKFEILYKNKKINPPDVVIPRVGSTDNIDLEISIIKQFQMMKIPTLNTYLSIARAKNKLRTLQVMTKNNIPVPNSIIVRKFEYLDEAIKKIGNYPVVIKTPYGTWGAGVALVESRRSLYSSLDIIWGNMKSNIILIQEYIDEADGSDYRAFVVGDKVVAAMKRTAPKGDFRSNLHRGGEGEKVKLTSEEEKLAVRASQALGLQISGVDILRSRKGPLIMEVNATPGFTGISRVSGVNVTKDIVKLAVDVATKNMK